VEPLEDRTVPAPAVLDPNLTVGTVASGLTTPIGMAFLGTNDLLVLEKNTGQVKRVTNGVVQPTPVLDLPVNFASERGLLSIALHPNFPENPSAYLYWTESTTGADTNVLSETPLLGNRVDRFIWDGTRLTLVENVTRIRAIQQDATNPVERGNHDGGVIRFGPDGKLYVFVGDVGRRGQTQNLENGPFPPGDPLFGTDDQFGGPEPDDAHLTGVVLRLNPDGTAPDDNPFADISRVFVARLDGSQESTPNSSTAKGFATFFLNEEMTALSFTVTVAGLDFTGSQTADPADDLLAAHIHAPAARGANGGVVFGFFGQPFNDTNPNDVVVTPFADGVGGTITSKWDLTEGNNTTLAQQLPNLLAGQSYINFHTRRIPSGEIRGQIEESPEATDNVHKIFSYGHRNGFGMAFDPVSGFLWAQENGDDSFSELNRVEPGMNGGWVQIMGPVSRIAQFKAIETGNAPGFPAGTFRGLQQVRWSPDNIADTPGEALDRLFEIPGSHYSDPEFSWKFEVAPGGVGFLSSRALGPQYQNDLFMGAATPALEGGYLFHFNLTGNRRNVAVDDPRLADRVADNLNKHEITESESLLFGTGFGVVTDIQTGPNGNLYVVSLSQGTVYEISRVQKGRGGPKGDNPSPAPAAPSQAGRHFAARLTGSEEVPARETRAQGHASFQLSKDGTELSFRLVAANIANVVGAHIHLAPAGENGAVVVNLLPVAPDGGRFSGVLATGTITAADLVGPLAGQPLSALVEAMAAGDAYVNVHTDDGEPPADTGPGDFPGGEIRGQIRVNGPAALPPEEALTLPGVDVDGPPVKARPRSGR
jgi:glucose/arabinose dehydrogenase